MLIVFALTALSISGITLELTEECSLVSSEYCVLENWTLDVSEYINPSETYKGMVFRGITENEYIWNIYLVKHGTFLKFDESILVDSVSFPGYISSCPVYSPNYQYVVLNVDMDTYSTVLIDLESGECDTLLIDLAPRSFWLTPGGCLIERNQDALRVYDNDHDIQYSTSLREQAFYLKYSPDLNLMLSISSDSICAYDGELDLEWIVDRDLIYSFSGYRPAPTPTLSTTGTYLIIKQYMGLDVFFTGTGDLLSRFEFPERNFNIRFCPSDSIFVMPYTDHLYTSSDPSSNFGLKVFRLQNGVFEYTDDFIAPNSGSVTGMPNLISVESVSNAGYILCEAYYDDYRRMFILSPQLELIWLSELYHMDGFFYDPFCNSWQRCNGRFAADSDYEFWYYDGCTIHGCSLLLK